MNLCGLSYDQLASIVGAFLVFPNMFLDVMKASHALAVGTCNALAACSLTGYPCVLTMFKHLSLK